MTTNDPDYYAGNRAPAPFRVIPADPLHAAEQAIARAVQPSPTWLQQIATGIADCRYGEMIEFAAGVLGKDVTKMTADERAEVIALADRFHEWSLKTKVQP